ncbi:energy-coupling factor transport system permease protein [Dethiosulfatibacter aminovorans DSM 17477]|uniref:Energy-coupling factor transport system permease protein n=1 Tax=Dethiosulfatibacter aminovorans DSM 17477 TaxID=1121476 RepID=A0A1M6HHF2_9FIRM|nr:energy-coupling factor transporter transmembrane component T [Dethiosulfatibacter aminovorans]SHJ21617.1 energy-coupling factor transport system permease protein [Dethiosulfatibacter aminovorans DSM 17477]
MIRDADPRTKLFIVMCISTLGLFFSNPWMQLTVFFLGLLAAFIFKASLMSSVKRLRKMMSVIVMIVILQSIFVKSGNVVIGTKNFTLITDEGLKRGFGFLMRLLVILISGTIISTCSMRMLVQGLVQMKLPYDMAFMTSVGIRFLPLLMEETKDTFTAIQLKGIDIRNLPLKRRFEIISYVFTPVIAGTLNKAKKLSLSVECRGFRAYDRRTSIIQLKFNRSDYMILAATAMLSLALILVNISVL